MKRLLELVLCLHAAVQSTGAWAPTIVAEWNFDDGTDGWTPNAHVADVLVRDGALRGRATGPDPMFIRRNVEIHATPWQAVVVRIKSDRPGLGELFWSNTTTGRFGGFEAQKSVQFGIPASELPVELVIAPCWHTESVIRQLRLDLFEGATFELDWIRVLDWSSGREPTCGTYSWDFSDGTHSGWAVPVWNEFYSPPLNLDVRDRGWANLDIESVEESQATLWWCSTSGRHPREKTVRLRRGRHRYYLYLQGAPDWTHLAVLALRLPHDVKTRPHAIRLESVPSGPPDLVVDYLGPEDALPRVGRPFNLLAQIRNVGAASSTSTPVHVQLAPGLKLQGFDASPSRCLPGLEHDEQTELRWTAIADRSGEFSAALTIPGWTTAKVQLTVTPTPPVPSRCAGVPEPRPVGTDIEICAYYFPGWDHDVKWDCIRRVAPIRKPLLGYYNEGNPECVDWQIKWAVENGISTFLVDWYWQAGTRRLEHWFEAYRNARHRDYLKVAIMWANHNAPGTHSPDDWRAVTRHWIERYFPLPTYQRLNGKPAIYLWSPHGLRQDVGGSEVVRQLLVESDQMARAAGYEGISFVALNVPFTPSAMAQCAAEGFMGVTYYHMWGERIRNAWHVGRTRMKYAQVVEDAPATWREHSAVAAPLLYLPVVDTGWDSRPWHGDDARVIEGRTPELFRRLLESARAFAASNGLRTIVLGPLNEWGEGSYIEPNLEFGFAMYEAVRAVFAKGDPSQWPINYGPEDIGLGPYDFPSLPPTTRWTFDGPAHDWWPMMDVADIEVREGALRFRTSGPDPALLVHTGAIRARDFTRARIVMSVTHPSSSKVHGQLFWQIGGANINEFTSVTFELPADGQLREVSIPLSDNPRWRGRISALRLDPCAGAGAHVVVDEFELMP